MKQSNKSYQNRIKGFNHNNRRGFHGKPACMKRLANQYYTPNVNNNCLIQKSYELRDF